MARSRAQEIGVGLLVLASLGLMGWMSLQVGAFSRGEHIGVELILSDAAGVGVGAPVKVAGIEVGRVVALSIDHDRARLQLELDEGAALRQDVTAQVRARSLLGEKYIELKPHSREAPLLADGHQLVSALPQTEIDQLVNSMGPLLSSLDPEALDGSVAALSAALKEDPERLSRILVNLDRSLANTAAATEKLPGLIAEAEDTLSEVRRTAAEARPVIQRADAAAARLEAAAAELPATVTEARALVGEGRLAVADGRRVIQKIDGSTAQIETVLQNLSEIDKWELRRLLREEGIVVRLRPATVEEGAAPRP